MDSWIGGIFAVKADQLALVGLIILASALIVWVFSMQPLDQPGQAVDWKLFHQATHGFQINYADNRVYNPPWVLALLWPFTVWPLELSRGVWAFATLAAFIVCVPRNKNWVWISSVVLLVLSYPMVRHLMDGNLEALIVSGVFFALYGLQKKSPALLAISFIFLSAKIQESWLFLFALAFTLWNHRPKRELAKAVLGAGAFVLPFFIWKGAEWLESIRTFPYAQTPIDSSLRFVLALLGVNEWIVWMLWAGVLVVTLWLISLPMPELDLDRAALLVTAGLMLSNYAAGNSLITPLALGVIPLFQRKFWTGLLLIILYFVPYLFILDIELRLSFENVYWAGVLLVTWAVLGWDLKIQRNQSTLSVSL